MKNLFVKSSEETKKWETASFTFNEITIATEKQLIRFELRKWTLDTNFPDYVCHLWCTPYTTMVFCMGRKRLPIPLRYLFWKLSISLRSVYSWFAVLIRVQLRTYKVDLNTFFNMFFQFTLIMKTTAFIVKICANSYFYTYHHIF